MGKGKKSGKGKKFVPFDAEKVDSQTNKKSNSSKGIKSNRNAESSLTGNDLMTSTSSTETSADISINSISTKTDESTDSSIVFVGQLDGSTLGESPIRNMLAPNNHWNRNKSKESHRNRETEKIVKNGIQNLSVSSQSDGSFQQNESSSSNIDEWKNDTESPNVSYKKGTSKTEECHGNMSNTNKMHYSLTETTNVDHNASVQQGTNFKKGKGTNNREYRDRRNRRNEATNFDGPSKGKGANSGRRSTPPNFSNSEARPSYTNVLRETQNSVDITKEKENEQDPAVQNENRDWESKDFDAENFDTDYAKIGTHSNQYLIGTKSTSADNDWSSEWDDNYENKFTPKDQTVPNWRGDGRNSFPASSQHRNSKRYSEGSNFGNKDKDNWNTDSSKVWDSRNSYDRRSESKDKEYKMFCDEERRKNDKIEFVKVEEIQKDLFGMTKEYSLGHCVAEDLKMGSGIAVAFKREFKNMDTLMDQRQKQGGLAVLEDKNEVGTRYIYYLITKRESTGKPTYEKFWSSLQKMRNHIRENDVKKLAIPRLGCGLDRLEWDRVKHMIEFLFRDVDVKITVCNFQQTEDSPEKSLNQTCKLVTVEKSIANIEEETTIIYLSSEDGYVSKEMEQLEKKFSFLADFKRARKQLGDVIKYQVPKKYYLLYGCIVRKTNKDPFQFKSFGKCISQINRNNKKECYNYIGIQTIRDDDEDLLMEKIITLLRNCMNKVDVYLCLDIESEQQSDLSK